jgi:NAD(P)-dependent dehydrogenase (short-subunit alcohol dehydrogenase family)
MQLADKVAIITGAGRGIGRAVALLFAREGAHIVIAERDPKSAAAVAEEVQALGQRALAIETDVAEEAAVTGMVQQTLTTFGTVDILVCNAGIPARHYLHEHPTSDFKAVLAVNLLGAFYCCKAVLPTMYAKRDGNIIFTISRSGQRSTGFNAAYCASKFAQRGLMESLAEEARAYGVRVNAVCPGGVKTELARTCKLHDGGLIDTSGFLEPEEVADAALFLASAQSRGMHGKCLDVHGGVNFRSGPLW